MAVFGFVLFFIGVIMLIYAPIHAMQNKRRTGETVGTITDVKKILQKNSNIAHPMYDYKFTVEYTVDGITYTTRSSRQATGKETGEEMTVCYNPAKPADSHIKELHGESTKPVVIAGLIMLVLGFVLFAVGVIK